MASLHAAHDLRARRNTRTGLAWAAVVIAMVGAAYASVPLYRLFCQVTGFGGTPKIGVRAPKIIAAQTITVRFDGNISNGLPWAFHPAQRTQTLKIGQKGLAFFEARNNSTTKITGTASFNVAPDIAGQYFTKIDCFCFTEQTLNPGETVQMPVTYFIDPAILQDRHARKLSEITLSYTFYPSEPQPTKAAAAGSVPQPGAKALPAAPPVG